MTTPSNELIVGYDYDTWYGYGEKKLVSVDASTKTNSHTLICGMSGSGKSYLTNQYLARICLHGGEESVVYFADFKQDDSFAHLRKCPRCRATHSGLHKRHIIISNFSKKKAQSHLNDTIMPLFLHFISSMPGC